MGNGERLVDGHGHELRHVRLWSQWLIWDDTRWARDETGLIVEKAKRVVRSIYTEASIAPGGKSEAIGKHAASSERAARVRSMIDLASTDPKIAVRAGQLDADPWVLNCRNGTLDLRTGELREHRQNDLLTRRVEIDYDEHAACPGWLEFLEWAMRGDQELIAYLQRAVGYSLTGLTTEQALFFLYGNGANGKSTFLGVVLSLLGDYATQTEPELLMARHGDPHPTGLADLAGKRFAVTVEVEEGRKMAESREVVARGSCSPAAGSITQPAPLAPRCSCKASAIWCVARSCRVKRLVKQSTSSANRPNPTSLPHGI